MPGDDASAVNQKVVIWARSKLGQKIGSGQCWDLADRALHHAGAQSSTTVGKDDDYVWGEAVDLKDVRLGDIFQFRDFIVTTATHTETTFEDGSSSFYDKEERTRRPHHTAVVDHVRGGGDFVILEQHVKPLGDKVQRHTISTRSQTLPPQVTHVRAKDQGGRSRPAKVVKTVTITVTGTISAYRPRAH
jgi:hypothetical protein